MKSSRRLLAAVAAVAALLGGLASAEPLAITDVSVVDVEAGRVIPNMTVLIDDDRIAAVGADLPIPGDARRISGRGRFLIPGLWDMHTHHQGTGEDSLALYVANGVTGTRDMGSDLDFILPLRERVARGEVAGPRIVAAGPMLDDAPAGYPWRRRVTTPAEAVQAVSDLRAAGVDFIKVHDHTPRDVYFAVAAEAGRQGLPFAGHVPVTVTVAEAVEAGQASIEHFANFRVFQECRQTSCPALYDSLASRGVWQTPTVAYYQAVPSMLRGETATPPEYVSPGLAALWRANTQATAPDERMLAALADINVRTLAAIPEMLRHNVGFLAGCDALVPGFCLHEELEWFTRAGLTPAEALRTATTNPAAYLGLEANEGGVKDGARADLVLLDANPLEDIRNTRRISAVILRGRLFDRAALDQLLAQSRAAFAAAAALPEPQGGAQPGHAH